MTRATALMEHANSSSAPPPPEVLVPGDALRSPETLAAVAAASEGMHAMGPWTAIQGTISEDGLSADLLSRSDAGIYSITHVSLDVDGETGILWFGPGVDPTAAQGTPDEIAHTLQDMPGQSSVMVSELRTPPDGGESTCTPLWTAGTQPDQQLPLASVAKVFVLGAVMDAVDQDTLQWDTELAVLDSLRSLDDGPLQAVPEGSVVTVQEAVQQMMHSSDNTATDLLHHALGPDRLKRSWEDMTGAVLDRPFRSTREVFLLGWSPRFAHTGPVPADVTAREESWDVHPLNVSHARWQDGLDWFASSTELCRSAAWLQQRWGDLPPEVASALVAEGTEWPEGTVLAKPGGVPGVVSDLVIVQREGRTWVLSSQFASEAVTDVGDHRGLRALTTAAVEDLLLE